jgi:hypothetical protein
MARAFPVAIAVGVVIAIFDMRRILKANPTRSGTESSLGTIVV